MTMNGIEKTNQNPKHSPKLTDNKLGQTLRQQTQAREVAGTRERVVL